MLPGSAVALTEGLVEMLLGETGVVAVSVGAAGAIVSWTYEMVEDEQSDTLPALSVDVARNVVIESAGTLTEIEKEPVPCVTADPAASPVQPVVE